MNLSFPSKNWLVVCMGLMLLAFAVLPKAGTAQTLLNVSYDPTREMYQEYNKLFINYWQKKTGQKIQINMSHGGSGGQSRAVIDGLQADVVTLALSYDIDVIAEKTNLIDKNWQSRLPHASAPYVSTIVFLVRKGNPKNIKDWEDLIRPDVVVITPNPKTSGGARWNYLAAWGYALLKYDNDANKAKDFMRQLFRNVPVLDTGARDSTNTFIRRGVGDVLISWENEALLAVERLGKDQYEIVLPTVSILAEPSVALVDGNVDKKGTRTVAEEYLKYLYSVDGQNVLAHNYYRPTLPEVAIKYENIFPKLKLFTIDQMFGGWQKAMQQHFIEGASFDQIYSPAQK